MAMRYSDRFTAPPTSSMDRHELAAIIRGEGIWAVAETIDAFHVQVVAGIEKGQNFHGWEAKAVPGIIRFARWIEPAGADSRLPDEGVLYINSDDREIIVRYAAIEVPYPLVVITKREGRGGEVEPEKLALLRQRYGHLL